MQGVEVSCYRYQPTQGRAAHARQWHTQECSAPMLLNPVRWNRPWLSRPDTPGMCCHPSYEPVEGTLHPLSTRLALPLSHLQ